MASNGANPAQQPAFTFWVLDTRELWPGHKIADAAPHALNKLSTSERARAQRFHFIADARLNVGSSLLKRAYISRSLDVRWKDVTISRRGDEKHGKPAYFPLSSTGVASSSLSTIAASSSSGIAAASSSTSSGNATAEKQAKQVDFNVSHQAGLVSLVGCICPSETSESKDTSTEDADPTAKDKDPKVGPSIEVGTDIVCIDERGRDRTHIAREGLEGWIRMHEDVFSEADVDAMLAPITTSTPTTFTPSTATRTQAATEIESNDEEEQMLNAKMRRFYAYWALKEAYVKLTGEALLASWLKEIEFRNVRVPEPVDTINKTDDEAIKDIKGSTDTTKSKKWGQIIQNINVYRRNTLLPEVEMSLQAFEDRYMIATAIKGRQRLALSMTDAATSTGRSYVGEPPAGKGSASQLTSEAWEPRYTLLNLERDVLFHAEDIDGEE